MARPRKHRHWADEEKRSICLQTRASGRETHSRRLIQDPSSGLLLLRHMAGFCAAVDSLGSW